MNNIFKVLAIATLTVGGLLVIEVATNAKTTLPTDCGCQSSCCQSGPCQTCSTGKCDKRCGSCGKRRRTRKCPQCECDFCLLELEHGKEEKTCFKTEQKLICVPPVRMPWMKDCPPGISKTKTITVLKKHKYECPSCSYKWTVQEPMVAESQSVEPATSEPTEAEAEPAEGEASEPSATDPQSIPEPPTPPRPPFEEQPPTVSVRF